MLAKSNLNRMETLVSKALIDMEINHEEFTTILEEKDKYDKMKENVRNVSQKLEEKTRKYETQQCEFKKDTIILGPKKVK